MKLRLKERFMLIQVLPQIGNYVTLKILRDLQESLAVTEEDIKKYNIKYEKEMASWDDSKDVGVEIEIGPEASRIIRRTLKALDEKNELAADHLDLFESFCGDG